MNVELPKAIFLLGTPGSKYNDVALVLEKVIDDNCAIIQDSELDEFLSNVNETFFQNWVILIYQKDSTGLQSWLEAGEQGLTKEEMKAIIKNNNKHILSFVMKHYLKLERFTPYWVQRTLGETVDFDCDQFDDLFVTIYQPNLTKQVDQG